jgi:hypothetical protein
MRHFGSVDRGFFAHFHLTLTALGHTPAPTLYGLKSWRSITMPGALCNAHYDPARCCNLQKR